LIISPISIYYLTSEIHPADSPYCFAISLGALCADTVLSGKENDIRKSALLRLTINHLERSPGIARIKILHGLNKAKNL
jgi:hypothetical protein